jgi:proteasome lid subunit RPN8/RPN11
VRIGRDLFDQLVAHARAEDPNECCGMVASRDGEAVRVYEATNVHHSPVRFEIDPRDVFRVTTEIDEEDLDLGAIYHSHTRTAPYPSQTDINLARNWPDPLYVIVGIANGEPDVRAFRIVDGDVDEAELEVV